jgi:hypothetical protein
MTITDLRIMLVVRNPISLSFCSLFLLIAPTSAETLRVTSWNLQGANTLPSNGILTNSMEAAATALKQLDPDVILLQQVRDWRMCSQLAQALKPAVYEVLICSAFPETIGTGKENRQAAILSKRKSYFSWSEPWATQNDNQLSGGLVFAAIQTADHRVGLFSVALDDSNSGKVQKKWAQQIQSIRKWVTNRPESAVVAAGWIASTQKENSSSKQAEREQLLHTLVASSLAANRLQNGDRFSSHLIANADALPALILSHFPQTCDLDLELAEAAAVTSPTTISEATQVVDKASSSNLRNLVDPLSSEGKPEPVSVDSPPDQNAHTQLVWLALTPLAIGSVGVLLWFLARRGNTPRREVHSNFPLSLESGKLANSDLVLITSPSITGSTAEESIPAISQPVIQQLQVWQQRALAAEHKAQQANDAIRTGLISYMREWLKQKLFRRLIEDRANLLESQHLATLKALAVDDRLGRIELQIQQQNQMYEQRIERLTQELAVTKEESRTLIRAQITQIKSEMEAARVRLISEAARNGVVS